MIDYSRYNVSNSRTFENIQETVTFAPIVLSKKLLALSLVFLLLVLLNVSLALKVSLLNYEIISKEKKLRGLKIEKAGLLSSLDKINIDKELQQADKLGLKPINTDQIKFYSE